MRPRHYRLFAQSLNVLMLLSVSAAVAIEQTPAAQQKGDGLLRSELSLGGRTAGLAYSPNLKASDPTYKGLLSAAAGQAARVRVAQLDTTGAIRIGGVDLGAPGPARARDAAVIQSATAGVRYSLWLEGANNGWQIQVTDADQAVVGTIPLERRASAPATANFVAALVPEDSTAARLAIRWGDYEATVDVQFINPSRRRTEENREPNVTTSRTHDEDTSVLSRARLLAERNESALVSPKGSRTSISFQRTFGKNDRPAGNRNRGLGVDGPDFIGLTKTPDGSIVMLTESSVPRLRLEAPLRFGKATIATGNQVVGFPGSYGVWLKRVGTGWRLVFNNEPDVWGSQHDPKSDAAEIELSHSEGHAATRPFSVALVPTATDRGRLVIIWGPHEWTADFAVA